MTNKHLFLPYVEKLGRVFGEVAPERNRELKPDEFMDLHVLDLDEFVAESISGERLMRISTAALEVFWCICLFNFIAFLEYQKSHKPGEPFNILGTVRVRNANTLVDWALNKIKDKQPSDWPQDLPKPDINAAKGSDQHSANIFFYTAIGFVMHHEHAHIQKGHRPSFGAEAIANERTADDCAAEWILGQPPREIREARAIGVLFAVLAIFRIEHHMKVRLGDHPDPMERVINCFCQYVDADSPLQGIAFPLLQMHARMAFGKELEVDEETFADLVTSMLIKISREGKR